MFFHSSMMRRIFFPALTIMSIVATARAFSQEPGAGTWAGKIKDFPRTLGDRMADVSADGTKYLVLRKERKPVQGEGFIDSLLLCDIATGKTIRTISGPSGEKALQINVAALSSDARSVATGNWYGSLRVLDVETGAERAAWTENFRSVDQLAFSKDGKYVASATLDDVVRRTVIHVYDVAARTKVATFAGHEDGISDLRFMSDGRLISCGADELICLWDLATPPNAPTAGTEPGANRLPVRPPAMTLTGHSAAVRRVSVTADNARAVSGGGDGRVCEWDLKTGKLLRKFTPHTKDVFGRTYVDSVVFLTNGTQFLSRGSDHIVRLWDFETGQELAQVTRGANEMYPLPDGKQMVMGQQLWTAPQNFAPKPGGPMPPNEIANWIPSKVIGPVTGAIFGISTASVQGEKLIVANSQGYRNCFATFDLSTGGQLSVVEVKTPADGTRRPLAFSADGKSILCGGEGGKLAIVDVATGNDLKILNGPRSVYKAIWTPDGKTVITSEYLRPDDGEKADICIWDVATGSLTKRLEGSIGLIWGLAVSEDGKMIVSGSGNFPTAAGKEHDVAVHVWDLASGRETSTMVGQDFIIHSIAISPDAKFAASGARQGPVVIWDLTTGKELRRVDGAENRNGNLYTNALAFSPDGKRLATGGADSDIKVWDIATGQELIRLEEHRKGITWLQWKNDATLLSTSSDGTARVWAVKDAIAAKNEGI